MEPWWIPILVALIGGPLMWFLKRLDNRNSNQHATSLGILQQTKDMIEGVDGKIDRVSDQVDRLDDRLYKHIESHASNERMGS